MHVHHGNKAPGYESGVRVLPEWDARQSKRLSKRVAPKGREISETTRNAIRSALMAGVKPTQVAKHFGVSLSTLRQIGSDPD